jgi:hypothetical protein
MKFLTKLAAGQVALWRVFWLIGTPLTLIWLITGAAMLFRSAPNLLVVGFVIAAFTLATLTIPFVSWAIWRSASNYPHKVWWHTALAWGAKACAAFWTLVALGSVAGLVYLGYEFVEALLLYA